ncbi:MAG: type II secretion system protein [Desulfobacterales bacterium]
MKQEKGLILIELIMSLVLIGIIASFTGFFIYSGINGYLRAKEITAAALDAQRALDRMSLELRYIDYFTANPVHPAPSTCVSGIKILIRTAPPTTSPILTWGLTSKTSAPVLPPEFFRETW